jgi:CRP-like cAMP-binding protein
VVTDVLALTGGMPERAVPAGASVFQDGAGTIPVLVLVAGRLRVLQGGAEIALIDQPGAFVGEIGALLGTARTAEVVAAEDSVVRSIGEPDAVFAAHPDLALELARQLAGRLHRLVAYLGDVREQYADRDDHLGMLDVVLARLSSRAPVDIEPGSDRSPDY